MNTECPNGQRLKAELEKAQAKIAALEVELRRGRRQAAPFSRDEPKPDPKPPGRRPGQGRFTYREAPSEEEIQETVQVPLGSCPECGGPLEDRATYEQGPVDLPRVQAVVVRFLTESGYCPWCRKRVRSHHPEQVLAATGAAGVSLRPRAKALAADLKHRLGIFYRKIAELFQMAFGLEVTASALCQADERLAGRGCLGLAVGVHRPEDHGLHHRGAPFS